MKEKLTLRNILLWAAGLLGLLVFIFSFVTPLTLYGEINNTVYKNIIWGCGGYTEGATYHQIEPVAIGPSVIVMTGVILEIIGAVCAVVMSLLGEKLIKDKKIRIIILCAAAALMIAGGIMHFFIVKSFASAYAYWSTTAREYPIDTEYVLWMWSAASPTSQMAIVSGVLALVGGASIAASQVVPDKKLVK